MQGEMPREDLRQRMEIHPEEMVRSEEESFMRSINSLELLEREY